MKKNEFTRDNFDETEDEIDLMDLIFIFIRRWKLIVLIFLPIFGIGVFFAATRTNMYKAETILMVSNGTGTVSSTILENNELSVNQRLARTYAEIAKSKVILNNVIKKYDLAISLKELENQVEISPVDNTELLRLTYRNGDPSLAAAIVNEIGNEFMLKVREVMNFQNIKVVEKGEVPKEALPKKRRQILIVSFLFGIMVGGIVAFIVEFFFCKLRKPKDIEKILKVSMLGMIPDFNFTMEERKKSGE